jgi:hypothetical protein
MCVLDEATLVLGKAFGSASSHDNNKREFLFCGESCDNDWKDDVGRAWCAWRLRVQLDPFGNNADESRATSCSSQQDNQLKLGGQDLFN